MKPKPNRKKPKYDYISKLVEGRRVVGVNVGTDEKKYGFIDEAGEEIVTCEYSVVKYYFNGYARVGKEKNKKMIWACINLAGDIVIPLIYDMMYPLGNDFMSLYLKKKKKWGAYHFLSKKLIIPIEYDWIFPWQENSFVFKKGNKYGALNKKGEEVIPPIYDKLNSSSEGLFQACIKNKWGFVDINNKVVFPIIYDGVWPFQNNQAQVFIDGEYGFIRR